MVEARGETIIQTIADEHDRLEFVLNRVDLFIDGCEVQRPAVDGFHIAGDVTQDGRFVARLSNKDPVDEEIGDAMVEDGLLGEGFAAKAAKAEAPKI